MDFVTEMRFLYDDYIETFNRGDVPAFLRFFAYPWAVDGPHGSMVIANREEHIQILEKVRSTFVKSGWSRSRLDRVDPYLLAGDTCMLVIDITRYREDNSIVNSSRAYYTFRRLDDAWKVVATIEAPRSPTIPSA